MTEPPCILPSNSKKMKPGQLTPRGTGISDKAGTHSVQRAASYNGDGGGNGPHPKLLGGSLAVVELAKRLYRPGPDTFGSRRVLDAELHLAPSVKIKKTTG